jgi:fructosamine-3-kinase
VNAPAELRESVAAAVGEPVVESAPARGSGSINEAWELRLSSGRPVFVKSRPGAPPAEFAAEAAGLAWLAGAEAVRVPEVLALGDRESWLALEWIEPGSLSPQGAAELGRGLAALHLAGGGAHGQLPPGSPDGLLRIGSVELPGEARDSWPEAYVTDRIEPLLRSARERGSIGPEDAAPIERVCRRIESLAGPPEPPARLHGDLWTGNVHADAAGRPWLIDPAAHGGHREIDLAMLRLFGSPGAATFAAYEEVHPLADGHSERVELWQLLPLLVHAVLFGGSYGAAAVAAARRYA